MCGWHLPSSTGTGSYSTLVQNYVGRWLNADGHNMDTSMSNNQLIFIYAGLYHYSNGRPDYKSSSGYYWSHTASSSESLGQFLRFRITDLALHFDNYRGNGLSLRCIAR